jgi:hypothetical protein
MTYPIRIVSATIDRPADAVYEYARQVENMPRWAEGLGANIAREGDHWAADTPGGRIRIAMTPRNDFRVLDHDVTAPGGTVVHNAMRVTPSDDGCVVAFVVLRLPGMSDADFARDADTVQKDLRTLKSLVETT